MHHVGQAQVVHVGGAARNLRRDIDARHGLAHVLAIGDSRDQFGLRRRANVEQLVLDQRSVGDAPAIARAHLARLGAQLPGGHAEPLGRLGNEDLAGLRRGVQDRGAAILHRVAARGVALVRGKRRVGGDELDGVHVHRELLGCDLQDRGLDALAKLGLAGEDGDAAIGADTQPRVEQRFLVERPRQLLPPGGQRKADDQRAAGGDEFAAVHDFPRISSPARTAARTMRICVPQRQRLGCSAARISASLAAGLCSSSACARIIMPGMQ